MDPIQQNSNSARGLLIGAVIVVVLGGAGYYFWQKSSDSTTDPAYNYEDTSYDMTTTDSAPVSTSSTEASSVEGYTTYTSSEHGFSVDFPDSWTLDETSTLVPVAFYSPFDGATDFFQENVNLTTEDTTYYGAVTLDEYSAAGLSNIQVALPEYVLVDQGYRTFGQNGYEGAYLLGDYTTSGTTLNIYSLFALVDGIAYVITYTYEPASAEAYQSTVDAMIASFRVN